MFGFLRKASAKEGLKDGAHLLSLASRSGDSRAVKAVVNAGVDVDTVDEDGMTALMLASRHNPDPEVVRTLISLGADRDRKDSQGLPCLFLAAKFNSCPDVPLALLDAGCGTGGTDDEGRDLLMIASWRGNSRLVSALIEKGMDPGKAFLHMAKEGRDASVLPLLAAASSSLLGEALLLSSRHNPKPEVVEALISSGADIDIRDSMGRTPLMLALLFNSADVAETLIDRGADLSLKDSGGLGVLEYASPALAGTDLLDKLFLRYKECNPLPIDSDSV